MTNLNFICVYLRLAPCHQSWVFENVRVLGKVFNDLFVKYIKFKNTMKCFFYIYIIKVVINIKVFSNFSRTYVHLEK